MSMPLPAAIAAGAALWTIPADGLSRLRERREQLTTDLRALAAALDGLDRRLADLEWRRGRENTCGCADLRSERSALGAQRAQLTSRLRGLARELTDIDGAVATWKPHPPRVGTCPDCGYPSLDSGLCAFCRPQLAH